VTSKFFFVKPLDPTPARPVPYGYDRVGNKLQKNTNEQRVIRRILAWREQGLTLQAIADKLNSARVPTKRGHGRWHPARHPVLDPERPLPTD
jgi:hypothetical protein